MVGTVGWEGDVVTVTPPLDASAHSGVGATKAPSCFSVTCRQLFQFQTVPLAQLKSSEI